MRVTSNLIYNQSMHSMSNANERYLKAQERIAEQSDIVRPSDDPNGAGQVMRLRADTKLLEQYDDNMTLARNALDYEEVALSSLNDILDDVNRLMIQSKNGANDQVDIEAIAGEIESLVFAAADLMNSKDSNGQYIFAGTNSSNPAFEKDASGQYVYAGNEAQRMSQVSENVSVATTDSGKDIFQSVKTRNTFTASVSAGAATLSQTVSDQDAYDTFVNDRYNAVDPTENVFTLTTVAGAPDQFSFTDSSGAVIATGDYTSGSPITVAGMELTLTGAAGSTVDVTLDTPTRDNVLNQVMSAVSALRDTSLTSQERDDAMRDAFASVSNTQTSVGTAISSVGARIDTINSRTDFSISKQNFNAVAQENIAGLDIFKATTQLELTESALSASQLLFQRISSLSLFNSL